MDIFTAFFDVRLQQWFVLSKFRVLVILSELETVVGAYATVLCFVYIIKLFCWLLQVRTLDPTFFDDNKEMIFVSYFYFWFTTSL